MSDTYDQVLKSSNTNNEQVHKIQGELKSIVDDNAKLQSDNSQLHDDITDLKCGFMRDNTVFLGISEDIQAGAATTNPDNNQVRTRKWLPQLKVVHQT